jgi:hypothetical protein
MEKNLYLIQKNSYHDLDSFCSSIRNTLLPKITEKKPQKLKLTITESRPPRVTLLPLKRQPLAMISITGENSQYKNIVETYAQNHGCELTGYKVEESPYVTNEQYWKTGEVSPGLVLLTVFNKKKDLTREQFMKIWFEEHSPMAITIHPFYNYIRNVVEENLFAGTHRFDSIVEEHFIPDSMLLNTVKMFGGIGKFLPNMIKVYNHVKTFIDMKSIENYICREYRII